MKVLTFNPNLCDGSRDCEVACAQTWFKVDDRDKSRIRISEDGGNFRAEFCIQCGECIDVCPTEAIYFDRQGIVRIKKRLCVGCLSCVGFCPYDVMYFDTDDGVAFKCIACGQCVKACPNEALQIVEVDEVSVDLWNAVE
jgi:Fe-S-cluster-containing hydrogenase component 2